MDAALRDSKARVERNLAAFDQVADLAKREEEDRAAAAVGKATVASSSPLSPVAPAVVRERAASMSNEERAARLAAVKQLVSPPKQYKLPVGYKPPPSLQAQKEAEEATGKQRPDIPTAPMLVGVQP